MKLSISQEKLHTAVAAIPYLTRGAFRKEQTEARQMKIFGASGIQVRAHLKREIWQTSKVEKFVFSTAFCSVDSAADLVSKIMNVLQKEWKRTVGKRLISTLGIWVLFKSIRVACLYDFWKGK